MPSKQVQKTKQRPIVIRDSVFHSVLPEPPTEAVLSAVREIAKACTANAEALRAIAVAVVPATPAPAISIH